MSGTMDALREMVRLEIRQEIGRLIAAGELATEHDVKRRAASDMTDAAAMVGKVEKKALAVEKRILASEKVVDRVDTTVAQMVQEAADKAATVATVSTAPVAPAAPAVVQVGVTKPVVVKP